MWHKFSKSNLDGTHPQNHAAIYLQDTNEIYYDVVLDVSTMEELQHVKRKTVGNSVVHEPTSKKNKVSVLSKKKCCMKECISDSDEAKHNDLSVELKCVFENKVEIEFTFNPDTENSQNFMCSLMGLPDI